MHLELRQGLKTESRNFKDFFCLFVCFIFVLEKLWYFDNNDELREWFRRESPQSPIGKPKWPLKILFRHRVIKCKIVFRTFANNQSDTCCENICDLTTDRPCCLRFKSYAIFPYTLYTLYMLSK